MFQLSSSAIISPPGAGSFELSRLMGWFKGPRQKICNSHQVFWNCRFEAHGLTKKLNSGYTKVTAKLLQKSFSSGAVDFQKDGEGNKNPNKFFYLMHTPLCLSEKSSQGPLVMRQSQLGWNIDTDIKIFNNAFSSPFGRLQEPSSSQNHTGLVCFSFPVLQESVWGKIYDPTQNKIPKSLKTYSDFTGRTSVFWFPHSQVPSSVSWWIAPTSFFHMSIGLVAKGVE